MLLHLISYFEIYNQMDTHLIGYFEIYGLQSFIYLRISKYTIKNDSFFIILRNKV